VQQVVKLEIPPRAEFVGLVRLVVSSVAAHHRRLDDDRLADLKLAVSEACTNAIEAHESGPVEARVVVRCQEDHDRFEVRVIDRGAGFDPSALPGHPPVTDPARLEHERGLGIPLIRALVDEVHFESSPEGTSVRLVVFCRPFSDVSLGSPSAFEPSALEPSALEADPDGSDVLPPGSEGARRSSPE
jgi:serine/threonine-protein kinase RsbW